MYIYKKYIKNIEEVYINIEIYKEYRRSIQKYKEAYQIYIYTYILELRQKGV